MLKLAAKIKFYLAAHKLKIAESCDTYTRNKILADTTISTSGRIRIEPAKAYNLRKLKHSIHEASDKMTD